MSKAEEKSLKAYPKKIEWVGNQWDGAPFDVNSESRAAYKQGYYQAEKDLELSWEDVKKINDIATDMSSKFEWQSVSVEQYFKEVLKRFKKIKYGSKE